MLNTLKIDKSPGLDELHPRVLKEISSSTTKPLCHIISYVAPCQKPSGSPYICSLHNGHCLKLQSIYPILPVTVVKWNGHIWSHKRLLEKIKNYGIVGPTLSWIEDFLLNRSQKVMVNGAGSEWENVTSAGIPQGSVLGSILYLICAFLLVSP
jgi:hypothetical protein